jgi:AraC-like DNA-binding protein
MNQPTRVVLPSPRLRGFISHYWISLDNSDESCVVVPDASVDLVINQSRTSTQLYLYGTSTIATTLALEKGAHYFGVCFRPGKSRHFVKAAAKEFTDRCEDAKHLLSLSLDGDSAIGSDTISQLNAIFENHVHRLNPTSALVDRIIESITHSQGAVRVDELATRFNLSRRHLERLFLETVGVSPKFFTTLCRFKRACKLIRRASDSLTTVALESGYSDQSHMTQEFRRIAQISPAFYQRSNVAFLQDAAFPFY